MVKRTGGETHWIWKVATATAIVLVSLFTALYIASEGRIMELLPNHIVRQKADIPQERLDKGTVKTVALDGQLRLGDIVIDVPNALYHDHGRYSVEFMVGNASHHDDWDEALSVGDTKRSPQLGIAVTFVALTSYDDAQGVRLLIEPCQDGPSIQQKADNPPQPQSGKTYTLRMGESTAKLDENYVRVSLGYGITKNKDGTYLVPIQLGDGIDKPKDLSMSVGQSRTADLLGDQYTVTLLALTDIHGRQGATLLVTHNPAH